MQESPADYDLRPRPAAPSDGLAPLHIPGMYPPRVGRGHAVTPAWEDG